MKKKIRISLLVLVCIGLGTPAIAQQGQFYFPDEDQSPEQQAKDIAECRAWATTQTNFNPAYPPPPPPGYVVPTVETGPDGSVLRGAARGAAAGAIGGKIFGKNKGRVGRGAAAGAAAGALLGGIRRSQNRRDQQAAQDQAIALQNQQQMAYQQQLDYLYGQYNSAVGVCMSGHGYTVG